MYQALYDDIKHLNKAELEIHWLRTGRVKRNDGRTEFILKWGMSSNTFFKNYLKIGTKFLGKLPDPEENFTLRLKKQIDRWKVKFKSKPIDIS